jgi:hypothetical protein
MRRQAFRVLVGLALLLATACGTTDTAPGGPTTPPASGAVPEVLDFELPLLAGGTLDGAELAGKDVAFWFWAPW